MFQFFEGVKIIKKHLQNSWLKMFNENKIDSAFRAAAEAVEEAILNSMVCAETTTGRAGNRRVSLREYLT